jgi:Zn-dependent M28 family amino/carboxypeptidase
LWAASSAALCAAPVPRADQRLIKAHLHFLADDLLEGRETGSRGYDIAALYVANQFRQYGVLPKGDKGLYLQAVPLRSALVVDAAAKAELRTSDGKAEALVYLEDFAMGASLLVDRTELTAPLVFAGYGIEAPRFKHNDYAGLDVKGKIVVVLSGNPGSFPTEEGAHFSDGAHKREAALRHGAAGLVSVQTPAAEKRAPFAKSMDYRFIPSMTWVDAKGVAAHELPAMQNRLGLSIPGARKVFSHSGASLDDIFALAEANKPLPHRDLNVSLHMVKESKRADLASSNVVGMIEGSDPQLKHEYVVFTAHLDHLGIVKEKQGDNLFNGAMDNASGVATLLETARMFAQAGTRPKRSILFIAVTGEEKGLLGADFFASNPTVPAGAMVANVNLDMPLLTIDFNNVVAFGAEHSSLKGTAQRALAKMGLGLVPDPWPEEGIFTRSDHYMFVRQGIPSVFIVTGMASFRKDEDGLKLWEQFLGSRYHQPNDDLAQPFNFMIGAEIANTRARPSWNRGDFFGDLFRKK